MQTGRALACCEQARRIGHLTIAVHSDAAHHVVRRRTDFHGLLRDVDVAELLELMIHAGKLLLDVLGAVWKPLFDPGDIEENTAMRAAAALSDFAADAPRDVVARQ